MAEQQYPRTPKTDRSKYLSVDTIAAVATSLGGAIALVRVSGPAVPSVLEALSGQGLSHFEPRKLVRVALRASDGTPIDDALVVYFKGPNSFTGEDCAEFHIHGSGFVATRLLGALSQLGVRQALAGEFSFRAVRNGKMNLTQAEAVADLIAASNDQAVSLALDKLGGAQSEMMRVFAENLRQLAVLGEAGIDFSDQDLDEVSLPTLKRQLEPLLKQLEVLKGSYSRGIKIQEGIGVAFVGLPNAGKSSFFNALLGEDRSIVSEVAGTTRDVVREKLTLQGTATSITLRLEDTAGLRSTDDHVEKIGIERTQKAAKDADLLLLIADAKEIATEGLTRLLEEWKRLGEPVSRTLGVITKSDLVAEKELGELRQKLSALGPLNWLITSAKTGFGVHEAARGIADFCEKWVQRGNREILLTRIEHVRAVEDAIDHMERAYSSLQVDLFAADLRQALSALGPLIGDTVPDDILGRIFSQFCIGK